MKKIVIIGGGLWGSLLAYFYHLRKPEINVELYERSHRLGGEHTWSFHETDVPKDLWPLIRPLISYSWEEVEVKFPKLKRRLKIGYHTILSEDFDQKIRALLPASKIFLNENKSHSDFNDDVIVFDCRNINFDVAGAWQNFVGLDVELSSPHGIMNPIIMDACVEQLSSFRFIYYLPWTPTRILVEDTRYTETKSIPVEEWKEGIENLIRSNGWVISKIERVEVGSLPIPFVSPLKAQLNVIDLSGVFHDVTGYSIADAFRVCDLMSKTELYRETFLKYLSDHEGRRKFYRLLNRLMFKASRPHERYKMLQHFYHLPRPLIERFYAGTSTYWDRMRVFMGKPPVSIKRALKVFINL